MLAELKQARFPVELGLLLAFCLFLPLVEFWKNAALLAYAIAWLLNRARARDFGGPWRTSDSLVALWLGAAYLAAAFAGLDGRAVAKTGDVAVSALLFWMVLRAGYTEREGRWILGTLVVSTFIGLVHGYWRIQQLLVPFDRLQLYSVGHVNHTAIYLVIVFGLCVAWLFARWPVWILKRRISALAIAGFMAASLVVTASRAAVAIAFPLVLVLAIAWWPRWRAPLVASSVATAITVSLLFGLGADVVQKQAEYAASHNILSGRDGIWRTGLAGWEKFPWFGVGKDNYARITPDRVRAWRIEAGQTFDPARYAPAGHAHNLYVNTLAERGSVGFASLIAILAGSLVALLRYRPRAADVDFSWIAWGGAVSAWISTAGIGLVNTTFHHEHGLLAALLLALWLSTLQRRPAS
jgi:O-antigen ligase